MEMILYYLTFYDTIYSGKKQRSLLKMKIAVITGASSGMGREFVCQHDRQHEYDEI